MSDLKDRDPVKFTRAFQEGVERAQTGQDVVNAWDNAIRSEEYVAAIHEGYRAAVSSGNTRK